MVKVQDGRAVANLLTPQAKVLEALTEAPVLATVLHLRIEAVYL